MDSQTFNSICILNQEIQTLTLSTSNKDDVEYQMIIRWLTNIVKRLEQGDPT